jgi:hypothetical protein
MKRLIAKSEDTPNFRKLTDALDFIAESVEKNAKVLDARKSSQVLDDFNASLGDKYKDNYGKSLEDSLQELIEQLNDISNKLYEISLDISETARDEYPDY